MFRRRLGRDRRTLPTSARRPIVASARDTAAAHAGPFAADGTAGTSGTRTAPCRRPTGSAPFGNPLPRPVERAVPAPEPPPEADTADDAPAPARARAPRAAPFRWVPRFHYGGGSARPAPAGLSTTMTTVVITTPAILAAAALRPGSRRRNGA